MVQSSREDSRIEYDVDDDRSTAEDGRQSCVRWGQTHTPCTWVCADVRVCVIYV